MGTSKVHSSKRQTSRPTLEQGWWLKRSPPMNKSHWNLSSEVFQRHSLATCFQVSLQVPCKHLYKWMSAETIDLIQQIMAPEQFSRVKTHKPDNVVNSYFHRSKGIDILCNRSFDTLCNRWIVAEIIRHSAATLAKQSGNAWLLFLLSIRTGAF